ncbi:MAG TPA: efflux transporter outer membrane subunit [Terriglobales bacterium]|nr:efflux transporter outer membrane subunit [Terriglobales bacterium]
MLDVSGNGHTNRAVFLIPALLGVLAGCTVGPKYQRPQVKAPETYRGASAAVPADAAGSIADMKWFEVFNDPQLQQLVRTALAENYDLREAAARVEAARASLGVTRADQFPTVGATADLTTLKFSSGGQFPLPAGFSTERRYGSVALNLLSFEVDMFGRLRRATEAGRANLLASEAARKAVTTTLVGDVANAYLNLLELDSELEIARRTLSSREDSLRLIRLRQEGGLSTRLDLRQAEQLVYTAKQTIPNTEKLVEQTENQISLLLGKNPGPITRGRLLKEQELPVSVPAGLPSNLLERRPDIVVAEQNLISANAMIGVARAAYFPRITLTGYLGTQSSALNSLFTGPTRTWQFVPQVSQPIFNAGRNRSNVRLAKAQQQVALVQYERAIQTAFREVSDSLIAYRKVKEVLEQQELLFTTLKDRSDLAYVRYKGGVDTLFSALDADRDLFAAELAVAQTRRDEIQSLVQLYKALGGGWQQ